MSDHPNTMRTAVQIIRGKLSEMYGREKGYYHFADYSPGIVTDINEGKTCEEIIDRVTQFIKAERNSK